MIITLHHVACDKGGCSSTGPEAHTQDYARADAQTAGWDISDDGDWCPAHKGIPACIRGKRAIERAAAERALSSLRAKLGTEGSGDDG